MRRMRLPLHGPTPLVLLAGLASFAIGFAMMRWPERTAPALASAPMPAPRVIAEPAAEKVDDSPAASKARIESVFSIANGRAGFLRDHSLYATLRKMDAADFLAAARDPKALAERLQKGGLSDGARAVFAEVYLDRWLALDAPGALHFVGSTPFLSQLSEREKWKGEEQGWSAVQVAAFRALARHDPQWTKDYLASQPAGLTRDAGIYALLNQVARQDSAKARQFLASFSDGPNRLAAVKGYVTGLAAADQRAGFDAASAEPAGRFRENLIEVAMSEAGNRGVVFVNELLDRIDDPEQRRWMARASLDSMRRSSSDDPLPWIKEEAKRTKERPGGGWAEPWERSIAFAVQGAKCGEAAEWAATLENDPQRNIFTKIVREWQQRDADTLRTWLAERASTLDPPAVESVGKHLREMAQVDGAAMSTWADSLPAGRLRDEAQYQVALSMGAAGDISRAVAAYESVAARDKTGSLARQLMAVVATENGAAAAQWAMQLPEGPARKGAIEKVAEKWSESDPRGAADWLGHFPAGPERDKAVSMYASKAAYADPAAAAEWVLQVEDRKVRTDAALNVFWTWSRENPAGARAWLRDLSGVNDAQRKEVLRNAR